MDKALDSVKLKYQDLPLKARGQDMCRSCGTTKDLRKDGFNRKGHQKWMCADCKQAKYLKSRNKTWTGKSYYEWAKKRKGIK